MAMGRCAQSNPSDASRPKKHPYFGIRETSGARIIRTPACDALFVSLARRKVIFRVFHGLNASDAMSAVNKVFGNTERKL